MRKSHEKQSYADNTHASKLVISGLRGSEEGAEDRTCFEVRKTFNIVSRKRESCRGEKETKLDGREVSAAAFFFILCFYSLCF